MKIYLLCLNLIVLLQTAAAQADLQIQKSPLFDDDVYFSSVQSMCRKSDREMLVFKKVKASKKDDNYQYYLEVFDVPGLQRQSSDLITPPKIAGYEMRFFEIFALDGYFQTFWVAHNKDARRGYLLTARVEDGGRLGVVREISSHDDVKDFSWKKWGVYCSDDKSGWMVERIFIDEKTKARSSVCDMFDAAFNPLWSHPVDPPVKAESTLLGTYACPRAGEMLTLMSFNLNSKSDKPASMKQVLWIARDKDEPRIVEISTPENNILLRTYYFVSADTLEVYGTYTTPENKQPYFKEQYARPQGTYYLKMTLSDRKISAVSFTPFPDKVFDFFRVKEKERKDGLYYTPLVAVRGDVPGATWMIFENSTVSEYLSGNKYHTSYTNASAFAIPYTRGKAGQTVFMPKGMHSDDNRSGHGIAVNHTGNTLHCLYNDSPKNRGKKAATDQDAYSGESPGSTMKGRKKELDVVCTSLFADGKSRTQQLFNSDDDKVFLNHLNTLQFDDNSFICVLGDDGKYQLVMLRGKY